MKDSRSEQTVDAVLAAETQVTQPDEAALAPVTPWGNGSAPSLPSVDNEGGVSFLARIFSYYDGLRLIEDS
jgi:hypothetical protein